VLTVEAMAGLACMSVNMSLIMLVIDARTSAQGMHMYSYTRTRIPTCLVACSDAP
jgi:hypothetical protein